DTAFWNPKWLAGAKEETLDADRPDQQFEVVLRRTPDPADIPPDPAGLFRSGSEMHLLHEASVGMSDDQPGSGVAADQASNNPWRKLARAIVGMTLTSVLQSHRQHEGKARLRAGAQQGDQLRTGGIHAVIHGVAPHGRRSFSCRDLHCFRPTGESRMDRWNGAKSFLALRSFIEPGVAGPGIAPEHAWQVTDPGLIDPNSVARPKHRLGGGAGHPPERVGTHQA